MPALDCRCVLSSKDMIKEIEWQTCRVSDYQVFFKTTTTLFNFTVKTVGNHTVNRLIVGVQIRGCSLNSLSTSTLNRKMQRRSTIQTVRWSQTRRFGPLIPAESQTNVWVCHVDEYCRFTEVVQGILVTLHHSPLTHVCFTCVIPYDCPWPLVHGCSFNLN